MWKTLLSLGVDVNSDLFDRLVEDGIGFHLLFDLLERVEHGRMVALAELAADIGSRQIRHAAHKVHRGLTGVDGLAASRRALDDLFVDAEVARRFSDDHRRRGGEIRVLFHKVLDRAVRGVGVHLASDEVAVGENLVHRALELTDVGRDILGNVTRNVVVDDGAPLRGLVFHDGKARFKIGRLHIDK